MDSIYRYLPLFAAICRFSCAAHKKLRPLFTSRRIGFSRTSGSGTIEEAVQKRVLTLWRFLHWVACLFLLAWPACAHDPGLSTATLRLDSSNLTAQLLFSIADVTPMLDLDTDRNGNPVKGQTASAAAKLDAMASEALEVKVDGREAQPAISHGGMDSSNNASVFLSYSLPVCSNLVIRSKWLALMPDGHRQFFTLRRVEHAVVRSNRSRSAGEALISKSEILPLSGTKSEIDWSLVTSAATSDVGQLLVEKLLHANSDSVTLQLDHSEAGSASELRSNTFADFLVLGVKHIWTGYDHLLFLFGLLIVTRNFVSALKIITCFTLAHSITLAVATLSLVHFSSRIVEPLIAASIVYVGIENLLRGDDTRGRWLLAFGFGLIHGFGFASVLRELGVGANGGSIVVPLVSFNLGVELGQIAIASLVLPIIWRLRAHPDYLRRWVPVGSAAVAVLGTWWFVQRVWF
ncbi:MAG: hypothetical protein C5B50_07180 [Verrucomicrobia bacterium]|nr:MAG: hypothetical protein C5B50_07180 [Verrucomicrobiota bacterium]